MYVLSAVRFATVMGCKDCTVVIGAAAGMVSYRSLAFSPSELFVWRFLPQLAVR